MNMNIDSVLAIAGNQEGGSVALTTGAGSPFSTRLLAEFEAINSKLVDAETALQQLAAGRSGDLHHVMLALEDARLSFQLLAQIRNKVLEAYQDVMRMQV